MLEIDLQWSKLYSFTAQNQVKNTPRNPRKESWPSVQGSDFNCPYH